MSISYNTQQILTTALASAPAAQDIATQIAAGAGLAQATQSANQVYAGPTSGGAAAPTFRALVAADIPSLVATYPGLGVANTFTVAPQTITIDAAAHKGLVVTAAAGQTADLLEAQNSSAAVLFGLDSLGRPFTGNTTPTIAAGAGAGTSPTVSISGTDTNGVITVTAGASPATGATIVTVTFSAARAAAPKTVLLTPAEANAAALTGTTQVFAGAAGISTTAFTVTSGSAALTATTTYKWNYLVLG
jgi:hypothetical protein